MDGAGCLAIAQVAPSSNRRLLEGPARPEWRGLSGVVLIQPEPFRALRVLPAIERQQQR
jgi:hypothetical protein